MFCGKLLSELLAAELAEFYHSDAWPPDYLDHAPEALATVMHILAYLHVNHPRQTDLRPSILAERPLHPITM